MSLQVLPISGIPEIKTGDVLSEIILKALEENNLSLQDEDILVLAQKIVSKAEGRFVNLTTVTPSAKAYEYAEITQKDPRFIELVLRESRSVLRCRLGTIIVEHRNGFVCANAGIDHSNVRGPWGNSEDWVLLLPEDADSSARVIRDQVFQKTQKRIGVMIIDSHGRAWRMGTVGVAIGLAGVPGLVDLRGKPDLYGYRLRITMIGAADELAAAASLVMGQADEGTPVVLVRGFPYPLRESSIQELIRPKELDLFR
ncbi:MULTISPECIES: coenzyme F420-0:L-glutamate ligase [Anaerolinea]|uniref:F420-0:gamma-glutamyl ligase n=1 Tax=Anaerolinea thermophila (strain DSM 14523 / JCM 11388 / NBRC 100420 / UNI-1) TaxID=926569 RepID=E8N4V5_ANATU|nr:MULTISPECIES: coenzyme F420-0:L-glutamate ligase [Anaerolinea]BAJ63469.1 F420-0:gamma-glutamyl ligase [Anaerolinea thermophila UNI-1]